MTFDELPSNGRIFFRGDSNPRMSIFKGGRILKKTEHSITINWPNGNGDCTYSRSEWDGNPSHILDRIVVQNGIERAIDRL